MQARRWLLTNNYKETDVIDDEFLKQHLQTLQHIKYFCFQLEKAESGTLHHQIFITFEIPIRFKRLKDWFPKAHIEKALGSFEQCVAYCTKEDTRVNPPIEWGEKPKQGKRSDLVEIMELLKAGKEPFEIMEYYPSQYFLYEKNIKSIYAEIMYKKFSRELRKDIKVTYLHGKPGTGKTKFIFDTFGFDEVYRITDYKNPFDMYNGEKILVFEEFRESITLSKMLNLLDIYPVQLDARYNNKWACFNKVFILSNWKYHQQYSNLEKVDQLSYQAWDRRIHNIYECMGNDIFMPERSNETVFKPDPIHDDDLPF